MGYKLKFNAPVVLIITVICAGLFFFDLALVGSLKKMLALPPTFHPAMIHKMLSYAFMHGSYDHLIGNIGLFLLVSPILEEKYGSVTYIVITLVTIILTAIFNILFFDVYLIGLSGVVFMNIILVSFTNVDRGEIPVTFILVLLLFVGKEVYSSFKDDSISQFAHIAGGLLGSFFGFFLARQKG